MGIRIDQLAVANTVAASDVLLMVKDPAGAANTVLVSVATLGTYNVLTSATPANSSITIEAGKFFYDTNYLYIAVATNTLKRVALTSF